MNLEKLLGRTAKRILADLVKAEIERATTHTRRNPSVATTGKVDQLNEIHSKLTAAPEAEKKG